MGMSGVPEHPRHKNRNKDQPSTQINIQCKQHALRKDLFSQHRFPVDFPTLFLFFLFFFFFLLASLFLFSVFLFLFFFFSWSCSSCSLSLFSFFFSFKWELCVSLIRRNGVSFSQQSTMKLFPFPLCKRIIVKKTTEGNCLLYLWL